MEHVQALRTSDHMGELDSPKGKHTSHATIGDETGILWSRAVVASLFRTPLKAQFFRHITTFRLERGYYSSSQGLADGHPQDDVCP